jgi:hypothetical protein
MTALILILAYLVLESIFWINVFKRATDGSQKNQKSNG